jgi:hypothetical protein
MGVREARTQGALVLGNYGRDRGHSLAPLNVLLRHNGSA